MGKKYFFDYIFWLEAKFFLEKANLYNAQNLKFLAIPRFGHIKSGPNTRKHCQKCIGQMFGLLFDLTVWSHCLEIELSTPSAKVQS